MKNIEINHRLSLNRVLAVLLCLAMCFTLIQTTAFAADTNIEASTQQDIVDGLNNAQPGDNIVFELQNDMVLGEEQNSKIIEIKEGVTATLINKEGVSVKIQRALSETSCFNIKGTLIVNENTTSGGSLTFDGIDAVFGEYPQNFLEYSFFKVSGNTSSLIINGGKFTNNTSNYGVIYSCDGANTVVNGGTFSNNSNNSEMGGGVLYMQQIAPLQ